MKAKRFSTARDAKEFLVAKITEEAERESVALSEVERKMLYFTETGWAPPDITAVNDQFDREYDQKDYEWKISWLIRHAWRRIKSEGNDAIDAWCEAVSRLREEDHYILVMLDQAGAGRPRHDLLKLLMTALGLLVASLALALIADSLHIPMTREAFYVYVLVLGGFLPGAYWLYRLLAGQERADALLSRIVRFLPRAKEGQSVLSPRPAAPLWCAPSPAPSPACLPGGRRTIQRCNRR